MMENISIYNKVSYPTHNNSYVVRALLDDRVWEKKITRLLNEYIHTEDIVIDCGAYIGSHTLTMSKLALRVYAFEPQPLVAKCLTQTLVAKDITNVKFKNVACDSKTGTDYIHTNNDGDTSLDGIRNHLFSQKYKCVTDTLDRLIPSDDWIKLIKIDVEGAEWRVLAGADRLISRCRPIIIMETFNTKKNKTRLDEWIASHNYTKEYISSDNYIMKPIKNIKIY